MASCPSINAVMATPSGVGAKNGEGGSSQVISPSLIMSIDVHSDAPTLMTLFTNLSKREEKKSEEEKREARERRKKKRERERERERTRQRK